MAMWLPFKNVKIAAYAALCVVCSIPALVLAQGNLSLTVTPPLVQLSVGPGNDWASALTVVNSNPYDLTVYVRAVDFVPNGEEGRGDFVPLSTGSTDLSGASSTLGSWITINAGPVVIPRDQTARVPYSIAVPANAPPGGHYAALLVSTAPETNKGSINIASSIASLVFLNVGGDVEEVGVIRDFYPDEGIVTRAEAAFTLRFENRGNVHLRPAGYITISNMWGRPRGTIAIGGANEFGNVLPKSIRKFRFTWRADDSYFDIGRYKAEATLTFGSEARQNITHITYFWVVPIVPVAQVVGAAAFMIFFLVWAMRRYVRHAVVLEAQRLGVDPNIAVAKVAHAHRSPAVAESPKVTLATLVLPLKATRVSVSTNPLPLEGAEDASQSTIRSHIAEYWFIAAFTVVAALSIFWINTFFDDVLTYERDFEISVEKEDGNITTIGSTTGESLENTD
jgi:hypothetical protein